MSNTNLEARNLIKELSPLVPAKTFTLTLAEQGDVYAALKNVGKAYRMEGSEESFALAAEHDALAEKFFP